MLGLYVPISLEKSLSCECFLDMKWDIETKLSIKVVASCFAALGSERRLLVLKTLVHAGPLELRIGQIGKRTGVKGFKLNNNMKSPTQSGLVEQRKEGRNIICVTLALDKMQNLCRFLLNECCAHSTTPRDEQSNGWLNSFSYRI